MAYPTCINLQCELPIVMHSGIEIIINIIQL